MKSNQTSQDKISKHEKERLGNKVVLVSSCAILYGMLLLFFRRMCFYSGTILGALTFMEFLMWGSLGAAMLCAAWSAYKEKKGHYLYCGMFLFVFLSLLLILKLNTISDANAYLLCFAALAVAAIMPHIYYALKSSNKFSGWIKIAFLAVIFIAVLLLVIAAVEPKVWVFLGKLAG